MLEETDYCEEMAFRNFNKPLNITDEDERKFKKAKSCHICGEKYTSEDIRVRDHCHFTGKYRGLAHYDCNLKLKLDIKNMKFPVVFHTLRRYDSHFIMQNLAMSQYLPSGAFTWLSYKKIDKHSLTEHMPLDESKGGMILEVDLEYPKEWHDLHDGYLVPAEQVKIKQRGALIQIIVSGDIRKKYGITIGQVIKLTPTWSDKEKCVALLKLAALFEFRIKIEENT
ncbi:hypothetical protein AWC38_SpisGene10461 [Stylophora pistillata]|uniref:Uncharacterized protein n=1 Tax=Stylophora pistillata TaxID=50429 RepID=A0A2B4S8R1_STYPI|nr:hypothetical protein AWC38_SpisGene10461 [Stylophora pistillata]